FRHHSCSRTRRPPTPTLFPYTTLFRSCPRTGATSSVTTSPRGGGSLSSISRATHPSSIPSSTCGGTGSTMNCRIFARRPSASSRSEEHTSELQSLAYLVCRLLLEKKKN